MDGWVTFGHGMYILSVEVFLKKVLKGAMKKRFGAKLNHVLQFHFNSLQDFQWLLHQVAISICKLQKPDQA